MFRSNRLASTLFAASLSLSAFFAQSAFAQNDVPEAVVAKIEALEQRETELKTEIARLRAEIDVVDAEIARVVVQASRVAEELTRASNADNVDRSQLNEEETIAQLGKDLAELDMAVRLAGMQLRLEQLAGHRAVLEAGIATATVQLPRDDTLGGPRKKSKAKDEVRIMPVPPGEEVPVKPSALMVVSVAEFTAQTPAEGWYAWKRQSQAWKKAHPWEGPTGVWCTNSARVGIPCTEAAWKKVPAGTTFLLPAPDVRVYVPKGVEAPKALALAPTADPELLKPDLSSPITAPAVVPVERMVVEATPEDKTALANALDRAKWNPILSVLSAVFGLIALFFGVKYLEERDTARRVDQENADLKRSLDEMLGMSRNAKADGCCRTEPSPAPDSGAETHEHGCCRHDKPKTD